MQSSHPEEEEAANPHRGSFCVAFSYPLWIRCRSTVSHLLRKPWAANTGLIHNDHLGLWGETATSESSLGSRSKFSMAMWVSEPGFLAFYPTADPWIKGEVTACSLGLRFGQ